MYSVKFSESRTQSLSARILREKHTEVRSHSPSTAPPRSPSLPEGGKGFVQISIFLQRISFVSVIFHIKIGIFYLNQFALTMEFRQTFSIKYSTFFWIIQANFARFSEFFGYIFARFSKKSPVSFRWRVGFFIHIAFLRLVGFRTLYQYIDSLAADKKW